MKMIVTVIGLKFKQNIRLNSLTDYINSGVACLDVNLIVRMKMKSFEYAKSEYTKIVTEKGLTSTEARYQRAYCEALRIISELKTALVESPDRFCAELRDKKLFEDIMRFK